MCCTSFAISPEHLALHYTKVLTTFSGDLQVCIARPRAGCRASCSLMPRHKVQCTVASLMSYCALFFLHAQGQYHTTVVDLWALITLLPPFRAPIGSENEDGSKKFVIRPYTPTSVKDAKGYFDLVVKVYPEGKMSKHIGDMKVCCSSIGKIYLFEPCCVECQLVST